MIENAVMYQASTNSRTKWRQYQDLDTPREGNVDLMELVACTQIWKKKIQPIS